MLYGLIPDFLWVLLRRVRYARAALLGSNRLAGERVVVPWSRDREVVRVIKRVASNPARRTKLEDSSWLWTTLLGDFWVPAGGDEQFLRMLSIEVVSDVYHFARQRFSVPPIVLDCGANIGMFTRAALNHGAGRVFSFEPSPRTADCLAKTFGPEIAAGKVTVVRKAVWNKAETLRFSAEDQSNPGSHNIRRDGLRGTLTVEACRIDSFVDELGLPRVDFIKMDIEGAEIHALEGAAGTIRRYRPLIGMGTEHTSDIAANNEAVIKKIRSIDPSYQLLCTEVHTEKSPSLGLVLTPYSVLFH